MKKTTLTLAITGALLTQAAFADQKTYYIDISDNLYYSGLIPEREQHPFTGTGNKKAYSGSNIPSEGYPEVAVPFDRYKGLPIGDCMRNVFYTDNGSTFGQERKPLDWEHKNTVAPDSRVSCFGTPPVVVTLADHNLQAGNTLHIAATGLIDDDTEFNYGPGGGIGVVDPRGQLSEASKAASSNDITQYAAIGVFAYALEGKTMPTTDQEFKDHVDAGWQTGNIHTSVVGLPGFNVVDEVIDANGISNKNQREFGIVEDLALSRSNPLVDNNKDGTADEGTGEYRGTITIPPNATHLILAYNAHQGGYYHHGDPAYFGALHPLVTGDNPAKHQVDQAKWIADGLYRNGDFTVKSLHQDQFPDNGVYAPDGSTRTVGVFKITLSDTDIEEIDPPVPTADITVTTNNLEVSVSAEGSSIAAGNIDTYSWDFGDGSAAKTGATAEHTYSEANTYTVSLTVTSDKDQSHRTTTSVTVEPATTNPESTDDTNLDTGTSGSGGTGEDASNDSSNNGGGGGAFGLGLLALLPFGRGLIRRRKGS